MGPTALRLKEKVDKRTNHGVGGVKTQPTQARDIEEGSPSDGLQDKDETEEQLEKLLFGDDAGFLEGLKSRPTESQLANRAERTGTWAEHAEDEDLESVADENVRTSHV